MRVHIPVHVVQLVYDIILMQSTCVCAHAWTESQNTSKQAHVCITCTRTVQTIA